MREKNEDNDHGAGLIGPTIPECDETEPRLTITVETLEQELAHVQRHPLHGTAFGMYQILVELKNMLKSGEWALLDRHSRLKALQAQRMAVRYYSNDQFPEHDAKTQQAMEFLQLEKK